MKLRYAFAILAATLAVLMFSAAPALAGEIYLGTIVSTDAGSVNNGTTATPFYVNPQALLTVQCDGGANVITDQATVTSTTGILLNAGQALPTSNNGPHNLTLRDAGIQPNAGIVAVKPVTGASTVGCAVWSRKGNEQ